MSKFSFDLEDRGIGGWLARNIEKITLAVAGLVLIALFTQGFVTPGLEVSKNPSKLVETASSTKTSMNRDSWELMDREKQVPLDHAERADQSRAETPFSEYKTSPLFSPLFPLDQKRGDPKILPPTDIEVVVAHGPLLLRPYRGYVDPMAGTTVFPEIEQEKPKRRPTRPRPNRGGEGEFIEGMEGIEGGLGEVAETKKYVTLSPAQIAAFQPGTSLRSIQPSGLGEGGGMSPVGGQSQGAYFGTYVVGVKALVPHELQKAEFEAAFSNAVGFNAMRDRPHYVRLEVERADVTDDPDIDPNVLAKDDKRWKLHTDTISEYRTSARFGSFPPELADPRYLVPSILTFPVPPLLLTDVTNLYLHSKVPQRLARMRTGEEGEMGDGRTKSPTEGEDPKRPEEGGLPGEGLPGTDLAGGRLPSTGGGEFGGPEGASGAPLPPEMMLALGQEGAEPGGEVRYEGGEGFDTAGSGFSFEDIDGVENKMVRFFDFKVKPERKYRYRIRIRLLDPNSPNIPPSLIGGSTNTGGGEGGEFIEGRPAATTGVALPNRMLQDEVIERLRTVKAQDEKKADAADSEESVAIGTYWRYSPWSEPSPIASVPARPEMMLAGPATAPREVPIDYNAGIFMEIGDHEAKMAAVLWDKKYAVNVPVQATVKRGSFLNFVSKADVVHPVRMVVRRFPEYKFDLNGMVVDIRGGEQLPNYDARKNPVMTAPSEMLMINSKGELIASEETEAADDYRKWLLIEDQPEIPETTLGGEGGFGEEMEGGLPTRPRRGSRGAP